MNKFMSSTVVLKSYISWDTNATGMKYARIIYYTFPNLFLHVEFSEGHHVMCAM